MKCLILGIAVCATMLIVADQALAQVIIGHGGHHQHGYSRGHYDYHPGGWVPHRGHFDYVPGHYHYHRGSHYYDGYGGGYYSSPGFGGYYSSPSYRYGGYLHGSGQPFYRR